MNQYKKIAQISGISLWLDDERDPKNPIVQQKFRAKGNEIWCKNTFEAQKYLEQGNVSFISFDNDLGSGWPEGIDLAKWILEQAINGKMQPPDFNVHSMNPIAAKRIMLTMQDAHRVWEQQSQQNSPEK